MSITNSFILERLHEYHPSISPVICNFYSEACVIALIRNGHQSGVELEVEGRVSESIKLSWSMHANPLEPGWQQKRVFTEFGACAIAFLLVHAFTEFTVLRQSSYNSGVDYFLGYRKGTPSYNEKNYLKEAARLEVSGIFEETKSNSLVRRLKEKENQVKSNNKANLPVYISVTEFNTPKSGFLYND